MKRSVVIGVALFIAALTTLAVVTRAVTLWNGIPLAVLAFTAWFVTRPSFRVEAPWPHEPRQSRPGGRADVAELSWTAFTRNGMVTERVLRRVRAIAARRLAAHGVLWDGSLPGHTFDGAHADAVAAAALQGWGTGIADAAEHKQRARDLLGAELIDELSTARAAAPRTLDHWFRALDRLVESPTDRPMPDHSRSTR